MDGLPVVLWGNLMSILTSQTKKGDNSYISIVYIKSTWGYNQSTGYKYYFDVLITLAIQIKITSCYGPVTKEQTCLQGIGMLPICMCTLGSYLHKILAISCVVQSLPTSCHSMVCQDCFYDAKSPQKRFSAWFVCLLYKRAIDSSKKTSVVLHKAFLATDIA